MTLQVQGTVQRSPMGAGTWALVTPEGTTYELYQAPKGLLQPGLQATVSGRVREDVMTIAMIGPVLEVQSFESR